MKKVMAIIFSIVIAISSVMLATTTTTTASNTSLLGDANLDGKLDTTDAVYILYYIALVAAGYPKDDVYSHFDIEIDERIFDVDRSEKIDTTDVVELLTYIAKCAAGQEATWPPAPKKIYCDDVLVFNPIKESETWNLRSAPSIEADIVTKMSAGETCKVIKIMQKSWYEVEYLGTNLYLQITPDFEKFFYVDPIPKETTSTTTEPTTTTTAETTTQSTEKNVETTTNTTALTTTKKTATAFATTKVTTETTIITKKTTTMESKTTTNVTTETKPKQTTTKTTSKFTTTVKTTDSSTTTSTEFTTTANATTEELQLGDIVTPTESVKLTDSNGDITIDAGEIITIVSVNENGNYIVIYQKQLYELDNTAKLNKVEHEYQEKQLSTVEEIGTGDILKFTGSTWYIRDESQSAVGTLKKNELLVVIVRDGNILTIITPDGTIGNIFCIADKYCMMVD